jgi:Planctomycete cytochrome C
MMFRNLGQTKPMNYKTLTVALTTTLALTVLTVAADDAKLDPSKLPPVSTATGVTYEKDIKPIFEASCVKCHHGEKAKHGVHLDTLEGALKGGKDGPFIVVGKSGESTVVYAVAHVGDDEDDFMPPPKAKSKIDPLTPAQIGIIRAWIDQGAK